MVRICLLAILVACHAPRAKPAAAPVVVQSAPQPHHTPSRSDPVPEQRAFVEVLRDPCGLAPHKTLQLEETVRTGGQCAKSREPIVVLQPARNRRVNELP